MPPPSHAWGGEIIPRRKSPRTPRRGDLYPRDRRNKSEILARKMLTSQRRGLSYPSVEEGRMSQSDMSEVRAKCPPVSHETSGPSLPTVPRSPLGCPALLPTWAKRLTVQGTLPISISGAACQRRVRCGETPYSARVPDRFAVSRGGLLRYRCRVGNPAAADLPLGAGACIPPTSGEALSTRRALGGRRTVAADGLCSLRVSHPKRTGARVGCELLHNPEASTFFITERRTR